MKYQLKDFNFKLDKFQSDAIAFVNAGFSVLVSAATGSGKTLIAEYGITKYLNLNNSVIYTAPIKALSNQKYEELVNIFGENEVGIITGDTTVNPDARLVVMTTEVLRNQLYSENVNKNLGLVILDEIHFIKDRFRGGTWEEIIINLDRSVPIICLSATISNVAEMGKWISAVHGDTFIIKSSNRPVPLNSGLYFISPEANYSLKTISLDSNKSYKKISNLERSLYRSNSTQILKPNRFEVIDNLNETDRLPAIYFIFSRNACDFAVSDYIKYGVPLISKSDSKRVQKYTEYALSAISLRDQMALRIDTLLKGLSMGVASHHSGVVPPVKQIIESLFFRGLIKVVFATETLSTGINMPARTVVIDSYSKRDDFGIRQLDPFEFTQMAGRAGRRGLDDLGWVILPVDHKTPPSTLFEIAKNSEYVVNSNFKPTYNTVLNLLNRFNEDKARAFLNKTFAKYRGNTNLTREFNQRQKILTSLGYINNSFITEGGYELKSIYSESDLLLHQFLLNFGMDKLDPLSVCAILAACIFERRGGNRNFAKKAKEHFYQTLAINPGVEKSLLYLEETFEAIQSIEYGFNFQPTKEPDPMFVAPAISWAKQVPFEYVVEKGFLSAGELIKNIRTMIDLANQLAAAFSNRTNGNIFKELVSLLDRDIITVSGNLINNTSSI